MTHRNRNDVMEELNDLSGFEPEVRTFGTNDGLEIPMGDGVGSYEFSKIRDAGYTPTMYDEVNDSLLLRPQSDV